MIVTVVDRAAMAQAWGHGLHRVITRTVRIEDRCPVCGGWRGKASRKTFHEDGETYTVSVWGNPCGHVDMYDDVLAEVVR